MIIRIFIIVGVLLILPLIPVNANANSNALSDVPDAQKVGDAHFTYMIWDVYNAALFAPNGQWDQDKPFALKLDYLMGLKGKKIAERSIKEMKKQGFQDQAKLEIWGKKMTQIFPDVNEGTSLTAVQDNNKYISFYRNDELIETVKDPEFTEQFFNIWLSKKTSEPELRAKLLGQK